MTSRPYTPLFALAATFGVGMTVASWAANSIIPQLALGPRLHDFPWNLVVPLAGWIQVSQLPAFAVGALVSGNVHQPSAAAVYVAIFVQWTGLAFVVSLALLRIPLQCETCRHIREAALRKLLPRHSAGSVVVPHTPMRANDDA